MPATARAALSDCTCADVPRSDEKKALWTQCDVHKEGASWNEGCAVPRAKTSPGAGAEARRVARVFQPRPQWNLDDPASTGRSDEVIRSVGDA